jgi:hypothetical protein
MLTNLSPAMLDAIKTGKPETIATARALEARELGTVVKHFRLRTKDGKAEPTGFTFLWKNHAEIRADIFGEEPSELPKAAENMWA